MRHFPGEGRRRPATRRAGGANGGAAGRAGGEAGGGASGEAAGGASGEAGGGASGENRLVDLARIAWLATVAIFLVAVLVLVLQGYYGYAAVTFAVAIAAAINLF